MNRWLQYFNLAGVLVLVVVCALQWRRDRALNLEFNQSEKVRLVQQDQIVEQERNLRGVTADLTTLKEQLVRARDELAENRKRTQALERENQQLVAEHEALQESITNWANAVAVRDERLATANSRIRELADQLNASIQKFNELATNYNSVVQSLNELRATRAASAANDAVR